MNIKPIKTRKDYRSALKDIESLMNAKANTPAGDRLDTLTTLIEAYEHAHFPLDLPDDACHRMKMFPHSTCAVSSIADAVQR